MSFRRASWLWPLALLVAPASAHAQTTSEAAVKAAFLVRFGAYVEWPAQSGPMTICVVGRDVLGSQLDGAARGQTINGRAVAVRRIDSLIGAVNCNIAYIGGGSRQSTTATLTALRSAPVLTVTDSQWSNARGMIHFQIASNRVRFHIDEATAARNGLSISSKLLNLALTVKARPR